MDAVHEMNDRLVLPCTAAMRVMDERTDMRQEKKEEQERTHLPLPESFPQPLEAGGIKVKMLNKTKGEERRGEETNEVLAIPPLCVFFLSVEREESITVHTNISTH